MRILNSQNTPEQPEGEDASRLDVVEKIAASILKKLQIMDERLTLLETAPKTVAPDVRETQAPPASAPPIAPVIVDSDAVKKGLTKMWRYLNDKAA